MDSFFGIGMFELVMIAVIALVVLGPERLPGAMREVAKYMRQLRQISSDFQSQFSDELKVLDEINPRKLINDALDPNARPTPPPVQPPAQPNVPGVGKTPSPPPARPTPPITNAESNNTILPPPPAPASASGAGESSVNGNSQAQSAANSDQGAETPQ